jgi:glycosyltransferase involved in cell wall biosynthesis
MNSWANKSAKAIEVVLGRFTDVAVTINQEDFTWAQERMGKRTQVLKSHGVGVGDDFFRSTPHIFRGPAGPLNVVTIGQLRTNKRQILALEAVAGIGGGERKLLVIGKGPEERRLRQRAAELEAISPGLTVEFIQETNNVGRYLAEADLMVHPSEREGLPTVVLESMASGLPVVAFDIRGCRDLLESGSGILVDAAEGSEGLARAIDFIRMHPQIAQDMSETGRAVAWNYRRTEAIEEAIGMYQRALHRSASIR